jgi:hypothetical protein
MAEQSAFLTAFDEMQKKKGGLNAPAPVAPGFKPQVPQEINYGNGWQPDLRNETPEQMDARMSKFFNKAPQVGPTLANEAQLGAAAPAVQEPQGQVPMLGGFEVRGAGKERFDLGTPEVPETLFSSSYSDPNGNTAAIASIEEERAKANAVEPQVSVETPEEFTPTGGAGFLPASSVPVPRDTPDGATFMGDVSTGLGKLSAPFTAHSQAAGGFKPEQPAAASAPFGIADATSSTATGVAENGVNSLGQSAVDEIQQQDTAAPQAQLPSTIQNAGGQNLAGFKPKYEGQSLTDYMAGRDDPSAASVQVQDPQGRFRRQAASVAGETPEQNQSRTDALFPEQADFEQASADREARQAARPDFGEAVSDRDRRAARGEGISDADRRDIAKAQSPNASASDRARGMKVAEKAGLDWRTGQPLKQEKETGGLTDYQAITAQQRQTEIDLKIADGMEEKEAKRAVAYEESRSNVRSTQDSFDKLRPVAEEIALLSGSKFTEGALGWTASKLPFSTDAAQIERLTTEFEGSAFLQGLIDAKAKGATFGALSEREGDRILGQWGKITSPKSKNPERIRAVNSMLESIQRSSERATSDHKEKFPDRSASSSKAQAQGSPEGKRHAKDQDHGAKVDTHFQT